VLLNDEARVFGGFHARLAIASRESLPAAMTSGQQGPGACSILPGSLLTLPQN
jgi:hypothetical protein